MKFFILLFSTMSILLCQGSIWGAYDINPSAKIEVLGMEIDQDIDNGGLVLGYNHPLYPVNDKMMVSIGGAYSLLPMSMDSSDDMEDVEFGFMSLYALPTYAINEKMAAWVSLGLNIPTTTALTDMDAESGLTYGIGVQYKVNDKIGAGLGYIVNTTSVSESEEGMSLTADYQFSRLALFIGYSL